jgi:hypothetical protein
MLLSFLVSGRLVALNHTGEPFNAPTTLTIVTGDPDSRKRLIGEAIADHITAAKGETCAAIAVTQKDQAPWFRYVNYCNGKSEPKDILVSSSGAKKSGCIMARPLRPSTVQDPHHQDGESDG